MFRYRFEPINGYVVMDVAGQKVLLDTGAPYTFGSSDSWYFLDQSRDLGGPVRSPCSIESISLHAGTRIDVVVGLDVLAEVPFEIDWTARTVTFAPGYEPFGRRVPLEVSMCGPVMPGDVLGRVVRLCVNTGATIGFLPEEYLRGLKSAGTQQGFLPTVGAYDTPVHTATLHVAAGAADLHWGHLPGVLGVQLLVSDGLVGTQLLERFHTRFDLARKRLNLATYPAEALVNDTLEFRLTVRRFAGLRALLIADDGTAIETIAARLPAGTREGCSVRVPAENGRYDWARAVLDTSSGRTVGA